MEKDSAKRRLTTVPRRSGVYKFKDAKGVVLYVGKALSLKDRLSSYFQKNLLPKTAEMVAKAENFSYIETGSEFTALLLEAKLIKLYRPKYNVIFKDDKSYLYIFISITDEFPKVFLIRKPKNLPAHRGAYFGPFPSSSTTDQILKWMRSLFPFCQQQKIGKRPCFYSHLGLCTPCPGQIVKTTGEEYQQLKHTYRQNIFRLKRILEGKIDAVVRDLTREMHSLSKQQAYEEARAIRDRINKLQWLLHQPLKTATFLENPNYYFEEQAMAISTLRSLLGKHGLPTQKLHRIECFDVSTISGVQSVASQVVFIDGIPEKSLYRRYRIREGSKPNDVGMLTEAIKRRLGHPEWELPDLLMVDGGKAQVSVVAKLLRDEQLVLPLLGLAKRFEKIVFLKGTVFSEITLRRKEAALKLLQQIRDEAHRFAITYHRKLRRQLVS